MKKYIYEIFIKKMFIFLYKYHGTFFNKYIILLIIIVFIYIS